MNRPLTAVFAALEAVLVVGVGVGIPLAALTVVWAVQFGFALDWAAFWRAGVDAWLVGHGADLNIALDDASAAAFGLDPSAARFGVTITALGFAALTFALALRAGRRVAGTPFRVFGEAVTIGTFVALALVLALSAQHPVASVPPVQGVIAPSLVFAAGVGIGAARTRRLEGDENGSSIRDWIADWSPATRANVVAVLTGAVASVAAVIAVAALIVAVLLAIGYAKVIALYESLHAEVLGGIALTLGQLALLPDLVVWAAAWLIGPGFSIGTGSSVSPLGTAVGPLPALPVLGALPSGQLSWGFLGLLVPAVTGFLAALAVYPRLSRGLDGPLTPGRAVGTGLGIGIIAGILLGFLAGLSSGSAGPGRLEQVGPDGILVGAFAALEIGVTAVIGLFVSARRDRQ